MRKDNILCATLYWVNQGRKVLGLPPLNDLSKGAPSSVGCCPIAMSLSHNRYEVWAYNTRVVFSHQFEKNPISIDYPDYVRRFVNDFDAGKYPEYIAC